MTKLSITSFDAVSQSEAGSELMLLNPDNTDSGLIVTVLGDNADAVQKHTSKVMREMRSAEAIAQKSGKPVPFDLDKIKEQNVEGVSLRVTAWKGVDEPFDRDVFKKALRRNPHWIGQIVEHSGNLANFTLKA